MPDQYFKALLDEIELATLQGADELGTRASNPVYLLALSPQAIAGGNQVLVQNLPQDNGTSADAIVVSERGAELRQDRVKCPHSDSFQQSRCTLCPSRGQTRNKGESGSPLFC